MASMALLFSDRGFMRAGFFFGAEAKRSAFLLAIPQDEHNPVASFSTTLQDLEN